MEQNASNGQVVVTTTRGSALSSPVEQLDRHASQLARQAPFLLPAAAILLAVLFSSVEERVRR